MSDPTAPHNFARMSKEQLEGFLSRADVPEAAKAEAANELTKRFRHELLQLARGKKSNPPAPPGKTAPAPLAKQTPQPVQAAASQGGCLVALFAVTCALIAGVLLAAGAETTTPAVSPRPGLVISAAAREPSPAAAPYSTFAGSSCSGRR